VDAALDYSFRLGLPFLPQIPIRNPWEFMIAQALEGLPGLQVERGGEVTLNLDVWHHRAHAFQKHLDQAFAGTAPGSFEEFEPSAASSSCWQPFVWELGERATPRAKLQIAGPLTSQWALRLQDGSPADRHADLARQIYHLVLARGIAMIRRLKAAGVEPLLYLDEPGLYAFSTGNPRHLLALQELKVVVQSLRKEGARIGLHCCSDTDWNAVLGLGLDYLSIDAGLSLRGLLQARYQPALARFLAEGGNLSLGVVPTTRLTSHAPTAHSLLADVLEAFASSAAWAGDPAAVRGIFRGALFTPACGLALQPIADAELVLHILNEFAEAACGNS
jgi:hypothetical protein